MALLLCVAPFHPLPYSVRSSEISVDEESGLELIVNNPSPHHVDFASFMNYTGMGDGCSLWSLYMGPVCVYENEHTAGKGVEVDVSAARQAEWAKWRGEDAEDGVDLQEGRVVRQLYIDDVNQLPVTRCMPNFGLEDSVHLYAPTLAACFRARGVSAMIERQRRSWRLVAQRHAGSMASSKQRLDCDESQGEDDAEGDEEEEHDSQGDRVSVGDEEKDEDEDEDSGSDMEHDAMDDSDGAVLEYVTPLMKEWLSALFGAICMQLSWTEEVAELVNTARLAAR